MEIIQDDKKSSGVKENLATTRSLYNLAGAVMILCGFVWLGSNYNFLSLALIDAIISWQMLVVIVGVWLLCTRNWIAGGVTTALGVVLVVVDYFNIYISFERLVLPLLLIVAGVTTICVKGIKR